MPTVPGVATRPGARAAWECEARHRIMDTGEPALVPQWLRAGTANGNGSSNGNSNGSSSNAINGSGQHTRADNVWQRGRGEGYGLPDISSVLGSGKAHNKADFGSRGLGQQEGGSTLSGKPAGAWRSQDRLLWGQKQQQQQQNQKQNQNQNQNQNHNPKQQQQQNQQQHQGQGLGQTHNQQENLLQQQQPQSHQLRQNQGQNQQLHGFREGGGAKAGAGQGGGFPSRGDFRPLSRSLSESLEKARKQQQHQEQGQRAGTPRKQGNNGNGDFGRREMLPLFDSGEKLSFNRPSSRDQLAAGQVSGAGNRRRMDSSSAVNDAFEREFPSLSAGDLRSSSPVDGKAPAWAGQQPSNLAQWAQPAGRYGSGDTSSDLHRQQQQQPQPPDHSVVGGAVPPSGSQSARMASAVQQGGMMGMDGCGGAAAGLQQQQQQQAVTDKQRLEVKQSLMLIPAVPTQSKSKVGAKGPAVCRRNNGGGSGNGGPSAAAQAQQQKKAAADASDLATAAKNGTVLLHKRTGVLPRMTISWGDAPPGLNGLVQRLGTSSPGADGGEASGERQQANGLDSSRHRHRQATAQQQRRQRQQKELRQDRSSFFDSLRLKKSSADGGGGGVGGGSGMTAVDAAVGLKHAMSEPVGGVARRMEHQVSPADPHAGRLDVEDVERFRKRMEEESGQAADSNGRAPADDDLDNDMNGGGGGGGGGDDDDGAAWLCPPSAEEERLLREMGWSSDRDDDDDCGLTEEEIAAFKAKQQQHAARRLRP